MPFTVRQDGEIGIIEMADEFWSGEEAKKLSDAAKRMIAAGHNRIAVDMSYSADLNSRSISVLMRLYTTISSQRGKMVLAKLSKRNHELLSLTNLVSVFGVQETLDDAVAFLKTWSSAEAHT